MNGWSDLFDWTPAGGSGKGFGWEFIMAPSWGNQKYFLLENVKVSRSEEQMEMW